jgi:hypothetical protein
MNTLNDWKIVYNGSAVFAAWALKYNHFPLYRDACSVMYDASDTVNGYTDVGRKVNLDVPIMAKVFDLGSKASDKEVYRAILAIVEFEDHARKINETVLNVH